MNRSANPILLIIAALLATTRLGFAATDSMTSNGPENLRDAFENCEQLWNEAAYSEYFDAIETAALHALSSSPLGAHAFATTLENIQLCLTREVDPLALGSQIDLRAKSKIAVQLAYFEVSSLADLSNPTALERQKARILADYLVALRQQIVPGFEPSPVFGRVPPPPETKMAFVGMNPVLIEDPVVRAKYEKAIDENARASIENTRQRFLRRILDDLESPALASFERTFREDPKTLSELKRFLDINSETDR